MGGRVYWGESSSGGGLGWLRELFLVSSIEVGFVGLRGLGEGDWRVARWLLWVRGG